MINVNMFWHKRNFENFHSFLLHNLKPSTKEKIKLNLLTSGEKPVLKIDFHYNVIDFGNHFNYMNYMDKVNWSISQDAEFSIKWDSDVFVMPRALDYVIDYIDVLKDESIAATTLSIANGCPTTNYFLEDFASSVEKEPIFEEFKNTKFDDLLNGIIPHDSAANSDFTKINKHTIESKDWNFENFNNALYKLKTHYKGVHPTRVNLQSQIKTLDLIIDKINKFIYDYPRGYELLEVPYLCNHFVAMKTKFWKQSVEDQSLERDSFDELSLNQLSQKENKKFLILRNGFASHLFYNLIPNHSELEHHYHKLFCESVNI